MIRLVNKSLGFFSSSAKSFTVSLFPGDGIGPEISNSVQEVFLAMKLPIQWQVEKIHKEKINEDGDLISAETLQNLRNNKFALKGPFGTQIGKGHRSINVTLRKKLNLYANVRPCKSIKGVNTPYDNVDLVTIRENTEGEYSGLEHEVVPGVAENLKIISEKACKNIAHYAFKYAVENNRKKVTACHKAGIMKLGDGLFKKTCKEVAKEYPSIFYEERQIDTVCLKLSKDPKQLDVMVMPNLYGDIVSDLAAGLIGGLGLTASANVGSDLALFEAVHGTAPDIAGRNLANPTAILLSSTMMLTYMGLNTEAEMINKAIFKTIEEGKFLTGDLGGKSGTKEYTQAIIGNIKI